MVTLDLPAKNNLHKALIKQIENIRKDKNLKTILSEYLYQVERNKIDSWTELAELLDKDTNGAPARPIANSEGGERLFTLPNDVTPVAVRSAENDDFNDLGEDYTEDTLAKAFKKAEVTYYSSSCKKNTITGLLQFKDYQVQDYRPVVAAINSTLASAKQVQYLGMAVVNGNKSAWAFRDGNIEIREGLSPQSKRLAIFEGVFGVADSNGLNTYYDNLRSVDSRSVIFTNPQGQICTILACHKGDKLPYEIMREMDRAQENMTEGGLQPDPKPSSKQVPVPKDYLKLVVHDKVVCDKFDFDMGGGYFILAGIYKQYITINNFKLSEEGSIKHKKSTALKLDLPEGSVLTSVCMCFRHIIVSSSSPMVSIHLIRCDDHGKYEKVLNVRSIDMPVIYSPITMCDLERNDGGAYGTSDNVLVFFSGSNKFHYMVKFKGEWIEVSEGNFPCSPQQMAKMVVQEKESFVFTRRYYEC